MKKFLLFVFASTLLFSCNKDKMSSADTVALVEPIVYDDGAQFILTEHEASHYPEYLSASPEEKNQALSQYWNYETEKTIALSNFDELARLYDLSINKSKIMVKVSNIDTRDKVKIEWLPYKKDLIEKSVKTPNYYFVVDRKYFDGLNSPTMPNGLKISVNYEKPTNSISARIGQKDNQYQLFINLHYDNSASVRENNILDVRSNHGGDAGIKIPPQ